MQRVDAPQIQKRKWENIDEFRLRVKAEMRRYMQTPDPEHILLIPAPPGSGKTWAGVDFAHWVYEETKHRVLYAGPRKDFYADVLNVSVQQEQDLRLWYDWKPRQEDDEKPENHTCNHAEKINQWLQMGYDGMDFCKQACGWGYINDDCPYHAQKKRTEPLIYGNHLHVTLGHPMAQEFAVIVGDELPLSAFMNEWVIPPSRVQFTDIPLEYDLSPILFDLNRLCASKPGQPISGPDLLNFLGGAQKILDSIEDVMEDEFISGNILSPVIPSDGSLDRIPANYLPTFLPILRKEAQAAIDGYEYLHRIYVESRGLVILTRRSVNEQMINKPIIWFDATGTKELYEEIFQRPVKTVDANIHMAGQVYQITDRANGKSSLLQKAEKGFEQTGKAEQLLKQIEHIAENFKSPAVITYQGLEESIPYPASHFYGSRGTNEFEFCDVLIVAGTPMPPIYQVEKTAKCLWPDRMRVFDKTWVTVDRHYQFIGSGDEGYTYPISQFADPDLNILLYQYREMEIVQAAHRARILTREKPVYLLTNLPVDELPPVELLSIRDLFGAPEGVNVFGWSDVLAWAVERNIVMASDLTEELGIHRETAKKYMQILVDDFGWTWEKAIRKPGTRGPLPKAVRK